MRVSLAHCSNSSSALDAQMETIQVCISHIFLCLIMSPLVTAFASVAFFKLLIFCVSKFIAKLFTACKSRY